MSEYNNIHQSQNMVEGEEVLTFTDNDWEWFSEEEAGQLEYDDGKESDANIRLMRKVLAKSMEDKQADPLDAMDHESPQTYKVADMSNHPLYPWFCSLISTERRAKQKAMAVRGELVIKNPRPGINSMTIKATVNEAWTPVKRYNAQMGNVKQRYERTIAENIMRSGEEEKRWINIKDADHAYMLLKADLAYSQFSGFMKDWANRNLGALIYRAQQITKRVIYDKAKPYWAIANKCRKKYLVLGQIEGFWSTYYRDINQGIQPWFANGVGEECDDPRPNSSFPDVGINLAWCHIQQKYRDQSAGSGPWFAYDREYVGKLIKENSREWAVVSDYRRRFFQIFWMCKKHKGALAENSELLTELAEKGKIYWWTKPAWYVEFEKHINDVQMMEEMLTQAQDKFYKLYRGMEPDADGYYGYKDENLHYYEVIKQRQERVRPASRSMFVIWYARDRLIHGAVKPKYVLKGKEWVDITKKNGSVNKQRREKKNEAIDTTGAFVSDFNNMMDRLTK